MYSVDECEDLVRPSGRERRTWMIAGAVVTAVTLVVTSVVVWVWIQRSARFSSEVQHGSYVRPVSRIELDLGSADVEMEPGVPGRVTFERHLGGYDRAIIEESWHGETFRVRVRCPEDKGGLRLGVRCAAAYRMRVPAGVAVQARSRSGNVSVTGSTGPLDLTTRSGEIELTRPAGPVRAQARSGEIGVKDGTGPLDLAITSGKIRLDGATGAVRARATSGRIEAGDLRSATVDAALTSGKLRLRFATAPRTVVASATSGEIDLVVPRGPYRTRVGTGSGDRTVGIDSDDTAASSITATAGSGKVHVHYPD